MEHWLLGAAMTVMAFVAERILVRFLRPRPEPAETPGFSASFADDR
jgi:hypothetical protein